MAIGPGLGSSGSRTADRKSLRCNANYSPRRDTLGLALRCASSSNRIELRANLVSRGNRVSGTWEERSYNVSGSVSGVGAGNSLRLGINGGGLSGFMVVTTTGRLAVDFSAHGRRRVARHQHQPAAQLSFTSETDWIAAHRRSCSWGRGRR